MSAAAYSRLLDAFRHAWVESGHALSNLEIRSPGSFHRGWEPSELDTVNYETEQVIAGLSLAYKAGTQESTEAVAVLKRAEWRSQELIDKFKSLCGEAGAALPLAIRNRLPGQCWMNRDPATWWI